MASGTAQNIINQINQWVRNYALDAFMEGRLNSILNQIVLFIDAGGGTGGSGSSMVRITSANFANATDCPLTALNGSNLAIFFNENQKYIEQDLGEWSPLVGGGFKVLIPGFNSANDNYHFYVSVITG